MAPHASRAHSALARKGHDVKTYSLLMRAHKSGEQVYALAHVSDFQKLFTNMHAKGFEIVHLMPVPSHEVPHA